MNPPATTLPTSGLEPIAIIGIGCLFPGSSNRDGYWANIRDGKDLIEEVPERYWSPADYHDSDRDSPDRTYGRRGGFLTPVPFRPLDFGITPRDLEATDTSQLLSLVAAKQALLDAGYDPQRTFDRSRVSVILGVTGALELVVPLGARLGHPHWWKALRESGVDETTASEVVRKISDSYVSWQENSFPGLLGNVVAGRIANRLDLHGTNCVTDAACASSLAAMHLASLELRSGRSDLVVTGGVDTFNDIFMYMCFSKTPALSPTGDARPFDREGDGTILGEGLGLVVLKRLSDAISDGDRIYARLLSIGTSSDGKGAAIYAPTAAGQQRALQDAYQQAGISPSTIELVEAHGTGTSVGDATELQALQEVFSTAESEPAYCALGSVKSQIGHTKAAAGAAGLIKAVLSLHHKVQPPSIKIREPIQDLQDERTPFHIESTARPWIRRPNSPRRAAVSSFGFGGSNFHAILEENSPGRMETDWHDSARIFAFSADSIEKLQHQLQQARASATNLVTRKELDSFARDTRARFHQHDEHRLTIINTSENSIAALLDEALRGLLEEVTTTWSLPTGIDRGSGRCSGSLAIIFPGQGSQKVDMLRTASCRFPQMVQVIDDAECAFWNERGQAGLSSRIWPTRNWQPDEVAQNAALRTTDVAQPAIGAVSLGLYRVLGQFGIQGDLFAGHSFGELTALAASGRLSETDFHQLANFRGRLMAQAGGSDAGSMVAVALPLQELDHFVADNCPRLVVANRNAPKQAVLSGSDIAIEDAIRILDQRGIRSQKLPVAAAFHSPEVAAAATPFLEVLQKARFHASTAPVLANSTGLKYPDEQEAARTLLAHQIARPVLFFDMVEEMVRLGATTFLEVGPGQVLTGLVRQILDEYSPHSVALACDTGKKDGSDLARAIARIAVQGHPVDLCQWDPRSREVAEPEDGLVVMIGGANLRPGEGTPRQPAPPVVAAPPTAAITKPPATKPVQAPATSAGLHDSQESLMQAIEQALEAQQRLARVQETAENLLEKSLSQHPSKTDPDPIAPHPIARPEQAPVIHNPPPVPTTTSPSSASPKSSEPEIGTGIRNTLVEVVAEKTGYPPSAVGIDLDLEADLGIDSIKRVEILSALREREPLLPAIPPQLLGTLRTIVAIADWYQTETPSATPSTSDMTTTTPTHDTSTANDALPVSQQQNLLSGVIQEVVADKTGYPVTAIGTDLDLEADLGIDSIKRVEILSALRARKPELPAIPAELLGTLRTITAICEWYGDQTETDSVATISDEIEMDANDTSNLSNLIVDVVAEKTGYPAEAIGTDLDLESDLGIDSIKRVEILSELRNRRPDLDAIPPEMLGTLRTILAIVAWYDQNSATDIHVAKTALVADPVGEPLPEIPGSGVEEPTVIEAVPVAISRPRNHHQSPSIPGNGLPFWVICDDLQLSDSLVDQLRSIGADAEPRRLEAALPSTARMSPIGGMLLILDSVADPDQAILDSFRWLKNAGTALQTTDAASGLVVLVQRCDGQFGLGDDSLLNTDPTGAALAGLAKCAAREWPQINVRAIDLSPRYHSVGDAAAELVQELVAGDGIEVGLSPAGRYVVDLQQQVSADETRPLVRAGTDGLVVVTGGARGVTAACVDELTRKYRPNLLLLGRTPDPDSEPQWCRHLPDDQLEEVLFQHKGTEATPAAIRAEANTIRNSREIGARIRSLEALGSTVQYRSVDVRDRHALEQVIGAARKIHGPVRGIIHGAGVLADSWITEKSEQQFQQVWSTKVAPARHLLSICRDEELEFISFFSSTTARLGRRGQSDYAAANETLNRIARIEMNQRPNCRVRSIGWGPWAGGMVDDGLRKVFHEEGVELLPLELGARLFLKTMEAAGPPQCVIVATLDTAEGALEKLCRSPRAQTQRITQVQKQPEIADSEPPLEQGATIAISVDLIPPLRHHVLGSRAVVPASLLLEWCATAVVHRHPGLDLHGVDDFRILKGVILENPPQQAVCLFTGTPSAEENLLRIPVEIRSAENLNQVHARAVVLLGERISARSNLIAPVFTGEGNPGYGDRLFHGSTFQCIRKVSDISVDTISFRSEGADPPEVWSSNPLRKNWLLDPLRIDAAFQALILWSREKRNAPCLPCGIDRLRCHQNPDSGLLETRIHIEKSEGASARAQIEILNRSGIPAITIEGAEVIIDASLESAFRADHLPEEASP